MKFQHPSQAASGIWAAVLVGLLASSAQAAPITVTNAGYWLETVGTNTIGLAGGGSAAGVSTTLFVANSSPDITGGTTATAVQNNASLGAVGVDGLLWARRVLNPSAAQLTALTVNFSNGGDTASFTGRDLTGLNAMPLMQSLEVIGAINPLSPLVSWALPDSALTGDLDLIQLVFYNDDTNLEVGNRVTLASTATSFQINSVLPVDFNLVVNVRLVDLFDDNAAFVTGNIQRESRAYANYTATVPEPASLALASLALAALGVSGRRARLRSTATAWPLLHAPACKFLRHEHLVA